jgi:hypothetical protein
VETVDRVEAVYMEADKVQEGEVLLVFGMYQLL